MPIDSESVSEFDSKICPSEFVQEVVVELRSSVTRKFQFTETKEEYEPSSDCSSGDETLSGESCTFGPGQDNLSGEKMSKNVVRRADFGATKEQSFCPVSRETS